MPSGTILVSSSNSVTRVLSSTGSSVVRSSMNWLWVTGKGIETKALCRKWASCTWARIRVKTRQRTKVEIPHWLAKLAPTSKKWMLALTALTSNTEGKSRTLTTKGANQTTHGSVLMPSYSLLVSIAQVLTPIALRYSIVSSHQSSKMSSASPIEICKQRCAS